MKEVIVANLKVVSGHFPEDTEKKYVSVISIAGNMDETEVGHVVLPLHQTVRSGMLTTESRLSVFLSEFD
jgi:hypothetical protein